VVLESTRLGKPSTAVVALEGSFPGVCPHVDCQPGRRSKCLSAGGARDHLLAGMFHSTMSLQVPQPRELRATVEAGKRAFPGVPGHVVLQRTHPRKPFLADVARVGWLRLVCPKVDVESAVVAELLPADRTRERTLIGVLPRVNLQNKMSTREH